MGKFAKKLHNDKPANTRHLPASMFSQPFVSESYPKIYYNGSNRKAEYILLNTFYMWELNSSEISTSSNSDMKPNTPEGPFKEKKKKLEYKINCVNLSKYRRSYPFSC